MLLTDREVFLFWNTLDVRPLRLFSEVIRPSKDSDSKKKNIVNNFEKTEICFFARDRRSSFYVNIFSLAH